jgi:hypothetical protein
VSEIYGANYWPCLFWSIKSHTKWVMFGGLRGEGASRGRFPEYLLERSVNFLSHINRNSAGMGCAAEFEPAGVYISNLFPIHRAFCRREAEK